MWSKPARPKIDPPFVAAAPGDGLTFGGDGGVTMAGLGEEIRA